MLASTKDRRKELQPRARYCGKIYTLSSTSPRANGSSQKDLIRRARSAAGFMTIFFAARGLSTSTGKCYRAHDIEQVL